MLSSRGRVVTERNTPVETEMRAVLLDCKLTSSAALLADMRICAQIYGFLHGCDLGYLSPKRRDGAPPPFPTHFQGRH